MKFEGKWMQLKKLQSEEILAQKDQHHVFSRMCAS